MKHESAQVKELAELFDEVSEATIRRDLELLATEGKLTRTHGGAASFQHERLLSSFIWINARWRWMKKRRIAKAAADLVENGDSIILDSGSTTIEIAKQLVNHTKLTIITNDLYRFTLLFIRQLK
ncbi:DeoR/GlpR family DNA-binding transcription regulator [Cohnella faecalis]|uniref:DeoR/GlpR transcriptional regulator n=1 Tax=Cohnella faecalis TaxID=2315694 RepID=A0A398CEJ3_9BACL|nr:DeoR/GlpR family DNA-binding transcription regulator [Cohnella faecalis]RIE00865.1 DeoR/GlpR transcriptional regulator [Cohnella faecalis]